MGESFTTNVDCGGIKSGSEINSTDTLQDIVKSMVWSDEPPAPPTEYESRSLGIWSSASDINTFFTTHTAWNGWAGLKLGNYVTIRDGTYNVEWEIAGFNCEHNQTAADGTVYDNGYGICMIPKTLLGVNVKWNNDNTLTGAYMSSTMHTSHLVTVANYLKNVLGDHLIQRNVLLSNSYDPNASHLYYDTLYKGTSNGYAWTTAYCTLMSIGQMTGEFGKRHTKYDDGEANYKLPVFDHENYWVGTYFWSRNIWGKLNDNYYVWSPSNVGPIQNYISNSGAVRPLIYLR